MNLRGLVNPVTSLINPNVTVTLKKSNGYTPGAGGKQIPSYAPPVTGQAQIQALDGATLQLTAGLNMQGDMRAIYVYGNLAGAFRADSKGGDLVIIPDGQTWLVTKVLETWPDWAKAIIVRQDG